jgi:hypothetical protein
VSPTVHVRIAAIEPPAGHAFDRAALAAAIEQRLAVLLAGAPLDAAAAPAALPAAQVAVALPASAAAAGAAVAEDIHRRLTGGGR